jgi:hypothetical protein
VLPAAVGLWIHSDARHIKRQLIGQFKTRLSCRVRFAVVQHSNGKLAFIPGSVVFGIQMQEPLGACKRFAGPGYSFPVRIHEVLAEKERKAHR